MKLVKVLFLLLCISKFSFSQVTLSGQTTVTTGETVTYTVNWGEVSSWIGIANVYWTVNNGTIISSDKNTATIVWDQVPSWENGSGRIEVTDDITGSLGVLDVIIENYRTVQSEFCNGFLGPRAVFETFGSGGNPGPQLPSGRTTYVYKNFCGIFDGEYTIRNNTVGCRSQWMGLVDDHTPSDVGGYMMMIDGDEHAKEIYRRTATGLNSSFRYEFSAWIASLSDEGQDPRVLFKIQDLAGNTLAESGDIPIPYDPANPWKQVSFMFDMPIGLTAVQVVLKNQNKQPYGNDFVVDDISFAPCYSPIVASFTNQTLPVVDIAEKCNSGTNTLYTYWPSTLIPFTSTSFQWERKTSSTGWAQIFGATTSTFTKTESSTEVYEYRVKAYETSNPNNYVYSNVLTFFVRKVILNAGTTYALSCNPAPVVLGPNYAIINNNPYGQNNLTFSWSPATNLNSTSIPNPTITLPTLPIVTNPVAPAPTVYTYNYNLVVNNPAFSGCNATNSHVVKQSSPRPIAVPDIFHPFSNVLVDRTFKAFNIEDYPGSTQVVRNSWGPTILFQSNGPTPLSYEWDGTYGGVLQPTGAKVWYLIIKGCSTPTILLPNKPPKYTNTPSGTVMLAY